MATPSLNATLSRAWAAALADAPLVAWDMLRAAEMLEAPEAGELVERLKAHLDHLHTRDAYGAFYAVDTPERPFLPEDRLLTLDRTMPRCNVVRQFIQDQKAKRVLEAGCYDGFILLHLALTEGVSGHGLDLAPHAVQEANRRAQARGLPVSFHVGFIEDMAYLEPFDAVLLLEVLEHVMNPESVLAACERQCAPDGQVIVSVPLDVPPHTGWRERKEHVRHYTPEALQALLKSRGTVTRHVRYAVPDGWAQIASYRP